MIRVKGCRPTGIEDIASWDLDNSTWGGWGEVIATVLKFSTPTNNHLRTSSNTRNQAVVQDGRVNIQTKNTGYGGNGNRTAWRHNRNQAFNAGNGNDDSNQIVQRVPRTKSTPRKANVQCYNYNEKGHYACDYQKPRVHDVKYFREQMLLAMKDKARSILKDEENNFFLDNSYGEQTMEELTVAVMKCKKSLIHYPIAAKSKNLGVTSVVAKSRFSVAKTPTATNKEQFASGMIISLQSLDMEIMFKEISRYVMYITLKALVTIYFWPMRVASINGKKIGDYYWYTWVYFLRIKDEAPYMIIDFINQVQRNLNAQILMIRTDNGTEFKHEKLQSFYAKLGIVHKTLIARAPQQNGVVKRINRTLVEATRTMLIFSKTPEFLWAKAIATACFTRSRSIVHTWYHKTPYELIPGKNPNIQYFYVFGSLCYPTNDRDDLGKMEPKADIGIFIEKYYATSSPEVSDNSAVNTLDNNNTSSSSSIVVEEDEAPQIVSSSAKQVATEPNSPVLNENLDEFVQEDVADFDGNAFYNAPPTPVFNEAELSSTYQDPSNMHEFHQKHRSSDKWTKNHPIKQVIGDPSKPIMTRNRLQTDAKVCMYALTVSTIETKNIKAVMLDASWIESMQDELNQFKRLDAWELVECPIGINIIAVKWI
nr:Gag-Pol polyprotein [Tanacetum cinerariifolium]